MAQHGTAQYPQRSTAQRSTARPTAVVQRHCHCVVSDLQPRDLVCGAHLQEWVGCGQARAVMARPNMSVGLAPAAPAGQTSARQPRSPRTKCCQLPPLSFSRLAGLARLSLPDMLALDTRRWPAAGVGAALGAGALQRQGGSGGAQRPLMPDRLMECDVPDTCYL